MVSWLESYKLSNLTRLSFPQSNLVVQETLEKIVLKMPEMQKCFIYVEALFLQLGLLEVFP